MLVKVKMKEIIVTMWFLSETQSHSRRRRKNVGSEPRLEVGQAEVVLVGRNEESSKQDWGDLQQKEKRQRMQITKKDLSTGQKEKNAIWVIKHWRGLPNEGVQNECGMSYPCE